MWRTLAKIEEHLATAELCDVNWSVTLFPRQRSDAFPQPLPSFPTFPTRCHLEDSVLWIGISIMVLLWIYLQIVIGECFLNSFISKRGWCEFKLYFYRWKIRRKCCFSVIILFAIILETHVNEMCQRSWILAAYNVIYRVEKWTGLIVGHKFLKIDKSVLNF